MRTGCGTRGVKGAASLTLALALCLIVPAGALAAASYVFDPTLSLTGNCSTSALDEVPDPGLCPIPPGVPGVDHPSARFQNPGAATDAYGDIYVVNLAEKKGRIDVFDPEGVFVTEFADEAGPQSIAVDSKGNVYLFERIAGGERRVVRYSPTTYEPEAKKIAYKAGSVVLVDESTKPVLTLFGTAAVAVDPATNRLYVDTGENVAVFGSAEEGNPLLEKAALPVPEGSAKALSSSTDIAIDQKHGKIYLTDELFPSIVRVFELEAPHNELSADEIDGSTTPEGRFKTGDIKVAVDEATGNVFVGDLFRDSKVYEFEEDGTYLATIEHGFENVPSAEIAIDNGQFAPKSKRGYLFVPSVGHVFAFRPDETAPPVIEGSFVNGISETEAVLHALINPKGLSTEYRLEYISQQQYEEEGESFANATVAGEGTLPPSGEGVAVAAPAEELAPGTSYRVHVFAQNSKGSAEAETAFKTYPPEEGFPPCANDALRTALSALLPDCRAYELVSPPDTNGRAPSGGFSGIYSPAPYSSPDGNSASFMIEGGSIPGDEGTGVADRYLATRGAGGWGSELAGPNGEEATNIFPGSVSPDQTYYAWEGRSGVHLRYPDGHSELIGRGSLGEDPKVKVRLVTKNAAHVIFETEPSGAIQLEPNAPPDGTVAVYDRSAEGPTRVVSLLPGDETPEAGENARYLGASEEGEGIAFEVKDRIYLRLHGEETFEVAGPGAKFAGVADEGNRVFYLEGGDLFAYDAAAEEAITFSSGGDVTPVNVATGGTSAYFVSPSVLTGEPNPNGEEAKKGAENLYLSEEGAISFVGIVTERDVVGEPGLFDRFGGLGLWLDTLEKNVPAPDPSRATPDGTTLLFESRANLAGFDSEGFAQVYRYNSTEDRLDCLSCSPTGIPPSSDASLQTIGDIAGPHLKIPNQTSDGKRAFFQTPEQLTLNDTDGKLDVYEWEEEEVGSCKTEGGCIYLISGGHSASPDYLFAMSSSGDDVFFRTADLLLPRDAESTASIYDARVGGGFAEGGPICEEGACCGGESCRPLGSPPTLPAEPPTSVIGPDGNVPPKRCPKGKHRATRHGKEVCVKKHHKKKHHRRTGQKKRGGSR